MSHKVVSALILMAVTVICLPSWAQDTETEPNFRLLRDSASAASELELEDDADAFWEPAIEGGSIEVTLLLGFMGLKQTILAHDQIIYKYNEEATYWGDMEIEGESAFCPSLRVGYNLNKWFSIEGVGQVSFSEYTSSVENRHRRSNESGSSVDFAEPPLGEFDLEARSLITGSVGFNGMVYPLNISGDGKGRWHPYVSGGIAAMWYDMNSNFTDGPAGTTDLNIGGGIRFLADRNISLRLDVAYHHNTVDFTPAEYFQELDEGTTLVPLNEYPVVNGQYQEHRVTDFESITINALHYSIGVQGSF